MDEFNLSQSQIFQLLSEFKGLLKIKSLQSDNPPRTQKDDHHLICGDLQSQRPILKEKMYAEEEEGFE
jgi:hypothetical protein